MRDRGGTFAGRGKSRVRRESVPKFRTPFPKNGRGNPENLEDRPQWAIFRDSPGSGPVADGDQLFRVGWIPHRTRRTERASLLAVEDCRSETARAAATRLNSAAVFLVRGQPSRCEYA